MDRQGAAAGETPDFRGNEGVIVGSVAEDLV